MRRYSYDRRQAGGLDPQDDLAAVLPGLAGSVGSLSSKDIAHASYVFAYSANDTYDRRVKDFAAALATEYAHRFAEWLGFVFLNRANMTRQSKDMKALQDALGEWVENIPEMLAGSNKTSLTKFVPPTAGRFLNMDRIESLGEKILKSVRAEYARDGILRQASGTTELPISYNPKTKRYEIPKSSMTFANRHLLRDLGFDWDQTVWYTDALDSRVIEALPQAGKLQRGVIQPELPKADPKTWFFEQWLPKNIDRFTKVFTEYGKAEGVPYEFKFVVQGTDVTVTLQRNIRSVDDAVRELESRYGGAGDREGWIQAVNAWRELSRASGQSSMHSVDMANNLEHTHGAMMEHFPPGVRSWYPKFLDFKYTADVWQLVRAIRNEDLRTLASELLPGQDRARRLRVPQQDHRTPKGLALEISSQPGKAQKRKLLKQVQDEQPTLYPKVVALLEERGLHLT